MKIKFEPSIYGSCEITDETGNRVTFPEGWVYLDGIKGKIKRVGYTRVYEQGYSGGYDNYAFISVEDLEMTSLDKEIWFTV